LKKYKPNKIALKTRIWLSIAAIYLLLYAIAELAIGYTLIPGRRGSILVSGIPTLMIAASSISLCLAAVVTVIDHYDIRPNEHKYENARNKLIYLTIIIFLSAPFFEILEMVLLINKIDIFPHFTGFAANYTLYTPGLEKYIPLVDNFLDNSLIPGVLATLTLLAVIALHKLKINIQKKYITLMTSICVFILAVIFILFITKDFLSGAVEDDNVLYYADNSPSKFNAILLTHFIIGFAFLLASLYGFTHSISLIFSNDYKK